jgi:hypothetical protein
LAYTLLKCLAYLFHSFQFLYLRQFRRNGTITKADKQSDRNLKGWRRFDGYLVFMTEIEAQDLMNFE